MFSKTVAASTEEALYEHATDLQLVAALQIISPFPTPFMPHLGEFSELGDIVQNVTIVRNKLRCPPVPDITTGF